MSNIKQIKNNFMKETCNDTWNVYTNSLNNENFENWDYIVLTASNKEQADTYKKEIEFRLKKNLLPEKINYLVIEDPDGKRVGSRGSNIKCFKSYFRKFAGKKI